MKQILIYALAFEGKEVKRTNKYVFTPLSDELVGELASRVSAMLEDTDLYYEVIDVNTPSSIH